MKADSKSVLSSNQTFTQKQASTRPSSSIYTAATLSKKRSAGVKSVRPLQKPIDKKVAKINKIALYSDRKPIVGLKKRQWNGNPTDLNWPTSEDAKALNSDEMPDQPIDSEECPNCKRTFR